MRNEPDKITIIRRPLHALADQCTIRSEGRSIHLLLFSDGLFSLLASPPHASDDMALALGRLVVAHGAGVRADDCDITLPPWRDESIRVIALPRRAEVYLRPDDVMPIGMVALLAPDPDEQLLAKIGRIVLENSFL